MNIKHEHLEVEKEMRERVNRFLKKEGIKYVIKKQLAFTRFTPSEMEKIGSEDFFHINLQHNGVPKDLLNIKYLVGVEIIKSGKNKGDIHIPPIIDLVNILVLESIKLEHSISVNDIDKLLSYENVLLNGSISIKEAIYEKYKGVNDISMDDLKDMQCFYRKFRVVNQTVLSDL